MSDIQPQLYLATPPSFDPAPFGDLLARVLDAAPVACLRLALAGDDESDLGRAADACREIAHARDIAVVIDRFPVLAARHGLDGVHLLNGAKEVRYARKELGADAIVGASCGASRHDGMNAGEAGADYVSFGPVGESALLTGPRPEMELFQWWSEVIEVPVVAEGALTLDLVRTLAPMTDFIALGAEVWGADDPVAALKAFAAALAG